MSRLGLPYGFKWFWEPSNLGEEFNKVISSSYSPPESWWQQNFHFINASPVRGLNIYDMAFCGANSRFDQFWPLIQEVYGSCPWFRTIHFRIRTTSNSWMVLVDDPGGLAEPG